MNNQSLKSAIALGIATALLSACSTMSSMPGYPTTKTAAVENCDAANMQVSDYMINDNGSPSKSIKIRVTGYGAPPKSFYPDPQRRLMAMRAAKIDAYRSLAERVTGVQIWGGTTIGDMVVEKDRFRVYLDTHLIGARVIAENAQEDGTYETVVELKVGQDFLGETLPKKVSMDCAPQKESMFKLTKANTNSEAYNDQDSTVLSKFYYSKD